MAGLRLWSSSLERGSNCWKVANWGGNPLEDIEAFLGRDNDQGHAICWALIEHMDWRVAHEGHVSKAYGSHVLANFAILWKWICEVVVPMRSSHSRKVPTIYPLATSGLFTAWSLQSALSQYSWLLSTETVVVHRYQAYMLISAVPVLTTISVDVCSRSEDQREVYTPEAYLSFGEPGPIHSVKCFSIRVGIKGKLDSSIFTGKIGLQAMAMNPSKIHDNLCTSQWLCGSSYRTKY